MSVKIFQIIIVASLIILTPKTAFATPKMWEKTEEKILGEKILREAFEASKQQEFIGKVQSPFMDMPHINEVIFYRRQNSDKSDFLLCAELYSNGDKYATFISNDDGTFAISGNDEFSARGGEFSALYAVENMFNPFYKREMELNYYNITDTTFMREPCYKIKVTLPPEERTGVLYYTTGYLGFLDKENLKKFYEFRPIVRTFIVGKNSKMIYSRKHYNREGKLILDTTFDSIKLQPNWIMEQAEVFDTPQNIGGAVVTDGDFYNLLRWNKMAGRSINSPQKTDGKFKLFLRRVILICSSPAVLAIVPWVLGGIGVLMLTVIMLYRRGVFNRKTK